MRERVSIHVMYMCMQVLYEHTHTHTHTITNRKKSETKLVSYIVLSKGITCTVHMHIKL